MNAATPHFESSSRKRQCLPSFSLLLIFGVISGLSTQPYANAGGYGSPTYSGGNCISIVPDPAFNVYRVKNGNDPWTYSYGGYSQGFSGAVGGMPSYASCTGTVTATYNWAPSTSPTPSAVIIQQTADAFWDGTPGATGSISNPLGGSDPGKAAYWTATKFTEQDNPPASLIISCSGLSAIATPAATPLNSVAASRASYQTNVFPLDIEISGAYGPTDYHALVGQKLTASLVGIPSGFTVTSYTWSFPGNPINDTNTTIFKNYDPTLTNNQLISFTDSDMTGPPTGMATVQSISFYDRKAESIAIKCVASITAPDGTLLSVTVKSKLITILKPAATWPIKTGEVKDPGVNDSPDYYGLGYKDSTITMGQTWSIVNIAVPPPFSDSAIDCEACFTQTIKPNRLQFDAAHP